MSSQYNKMIQSLKDAFKSSWLKLSFQHTPLGELFNQENPPSPWSFFQAYFSSSWWTRLWFNSLERCNQNNFNAFELSARYLKESKLYNEENVNTFSKHDADDLKSALTQLNDAKLLTQENFTIVAAHANPRDLAFALSRLRRAGILSQENFTVVAAHAKPEYLANALASLQEDGILTEVNRAVVASHLNLRYLDSVLSILQRAGILTQANFTVVAAHANPRDLAEALSRLQQAGILTEENRAVVAAHANPYILAAALSRLQEAGMLTEENRAVVAAHANPVGLANALSYLQQAGILTEENFAVVAANHPISLARALSDLQRAGILTQENRAVVAAHAYPWALVFALTRLQQARILTQENFNALLTPNHAALVSEEARQLIWDRIPSHLLTQANFERLVTASEHANPMAELERVRDQILGAEARAGHAAAFNPRQSTHTASVHRSVSESAIKLMGSYGKDLDIETVIGNIITFVNSLESSFTHDAAKRCIERITAWDYTFTDSSGVSTRQLLALAYTAIHDESKRQGTLGQALALFVEGLYEIQRGYNLNADGIDDGSSVDVSICVAGTFNKLMEKLNGIHPDVEVYFITHEGAYIKFPKVVKEHTLTYLNRLACPETATDYLAIKELLDSMQDNGLEPIWDKIKADVELVLWDEFKEAYADNPNHQQFRAMIDNGSYSNAPDLSELYSSLETSSGYQVCTIILFSLHQHSLWANRHASPDAQREFDNQLGLAIAPSK